ncbi:hypothetical protein P691DRAFT_789559 [Macrolepiota fuliginosa MF-IS2]|uniref:Uncharacterized protein n=1 Tax=Macrolepiota fuliginosa MF-IS2 TaxID=1400762 RepID=A0A9P5X143_9AGAR|nr:hypothetical protein P691DRAFT_789559 [Macrolepiota fuliginosa MF-IS2]
MPLLVQVRLEIRGASGVLRIGSLYFCRLWNQGGFRVAVKPSDEPLRKSETRTSPPVESGEGEKEHASMSESVTRVAEEEFRVGGWTQGITTRLEALVPPPTTHCSTCAHARLNTTFSVQSIDKSRFNYILSSGLTFSVSVTVTAPYASDPHGFASTTATTIVGNPLVQRLLPLNW